MFFCTFCGFVLLVATLSGSSAVPLDTRIVNGVTATNGQYPYMVSLRSANIHFCGGSIINNNWVLTAAQCFNTITNYAITVGTNNLNAGGTNYATVTHLKHPSYNPTTLNYDAAVVKTAIPIGFSLTIKAVALTSTIPNVGSNSIVTGWGYTVFPLSPYSVDLKALTTKLISQTDCQNRLNSLTYTIAQTHSCAYIGRSGACIGDEGSPLVFNNAQFGILSTYTCGQGFPDMDKSGKLFREYTATVN
ncbi:hypothetical protein RN001_011404 [Aquatica leii]|uniref:Peptidase S1 domain-containing protein n=1 Tax=Aquatica leii TaxID=1421715 RepID=A0AAN7QI38_9COLE|nr:hypothetical protein RN001_011404 [Aquatica leii]